MEDCGKDGMDKQGGSKMMKKYRVRVDGREYEVEVEGVDEEEGDIKRGSVVQGPRREKEKIVSGSHKVAAAGEKVVFSPMPARVEKINCRVGEAVKKGALLVVIEAMKMENEIRSPIDGVIKEVCVVEGANVSSDEKLVVFE